MLRTIAIHTAESVRPYKNALSHEEAVGILRSGRGKHFDPTLVDIFEQVSEEFRRSSNSG